LYFKGELNKADHEVDQERAALSRRVGHYREGMNLRHQILLIEIQSIKASITLILDACEGFNGDSICPPIPGKVRLNNKSYRFLVTKL
jgi:hypothetical protein